jgi:hypothetical protein
MKSLADAGGIRVRGPVAELRSRGCKAGLVYEWEFTGWQREWRLEAERYKLDPLIVNGTREIEINLEIGPGRLTGKGTIWTDYEADNHSHRAIIIKGGELQWRKQRAVSAQG